MENDANIKKPTFKPIAANEFPHKWEARGRRPLWITLVNDFLSSGSEYAEIECETHDLPHARSALDIAIRRMGAPAQMRQSGGKLFIRRLTGTDIEEGSGAYEQI